METTFSCQAHSASFPCSSFIEETFGHVMKLKTGVVRQETVVSLSSNQSADLVCDRN